VNKKDIDGIGGKITQKKKKVVKRGYVTQSASPHYDLEAGDGVEGTSGEGQYMNAEDKERRKELLYYTIVWRWRTRGKKKKGQNSIPYSVPGSGSV